MPRTLWITVAALLLAACASEPPPTRVLLQFQASADLNPSASGQAAPVRVRLYELKSGAAFSRADYFSLVESPQATLAADLIEQDELLIQPGDRQELERALDASTRLLGIVVAYRDLDSAVWRQLVSIPANEESRFDITLGARAVSAMPAEEK
ncbi:type VI secretion system-associated lipoprotein [Pseudomonas sp. PIC25]|uniref:type VI secretion system lipoprotein TssJ n=1 Tax=Pseudomonas sp. PIC25 TaxID=1958773 RepID=UPI000BABD66E|nr:type VI secretion system lipoprotein TssJ [Pseudomonas sp. PIC25]PAU61561.1 type VI secretion system-associated lipoprotein [Pseudomonas sp. PIC25]